MSKFEIRTDTQMTLDFIIEAEDAYDAKDKVREYLKHVPGGKLDHQKIRIITDNNDKLTNCFVMENQIDDCNEI